jgi:hypothetical protein
MGDLVLFGAEPPEVSMGNEVVQHHHAFDRPFARAEADLSMPTFASNRARITLSGRYIDAPDVRYYGVGNASLKDDESRFGYTPTTGGSRLDVEVSQYFSIGGGVTITTSRPPTAARRRP